ncbi:MAG: pyridoxamine 5'-phosphate oxidase family protein [Acidobacteria bacterium]|nr:pyridoxamine 5'-phosphate oxidase family protein [Acidobacteriota bacterium]
MRIEPLDEANYLAITNYSEDGSSHVDAVWFAGQGGRFVFRTPSNDDLAQRLRSTDRVEVAVSDAKGRVQPGAVTLAAIARERPDDLVAAGELIARKYGLRWRRSELGSDLWRKVASRDDPEMTIFEITLTEAI